MVNVIKAVTKEPNIISEKITIRPSSLDSYVACPQQWYNVFILGKKTIPNIRATIGTGVHKGAELLWKESIAAKKKVINIDVVEGASIESFRKEIKDKEDTNFDNLTMNQAESLVREGTNAFVNDIVPQVDIPENVEERRTIEFDHKVVKCLSGTIDYITNTTTADIKTSKRKIIPTSYDLQQSTYVLLAEFGKKQKIHKTNIQGVVFGRNETYGSISEVPIDREMVKYIINNLLAKLDLLYTGKIDPAILFPGNHKYYLCNDRFCNLRPTCKFVNQTSRRFENGQNHFG